MNTILLQLWGGVFYLLNKLFFMYAEWSYDPGNQKKWKRWAWSVYLIGLPPWLAVFYYEHNWIAAAVESSGVPSMLLGLCSTWRDNTRIYKTQWLDHLSKLMIIFGLGLSVHDFGGFVSLNQFLESGIAAGFLMGTYLLAKSKSYGYLWLATGNICAAFLMMRQGYFIMMAQQIVSVVVVLTAHRIQRSRIT